MPRRHIIAGIEDEESMEMPSEHWLIILANHPRRNPHKKFGKVMIAKVAAGFFGERQCRSNLCQEVLERVEHLLTKYVTTMGSVYPKLART